MVRRAASVGFVVMLVACTRDFDGLFTPTPKDGKADVDNGDDTSCTCACKGPSCQFTCPSSCSKCTCDCPAGTDCSVVGDVTIDLTCEKGSTCSCKSSSCDMNCVDGKPAECGVITACNSCPK